MIYYLLTVLLQEVLNNTTAIKREFYLCM